MQPPPLVIGALPEAASSAPVAASHQPKFHHVVVHYATDRAEAEFTFRILLQRFRWASIAMLVLLGLPLVHRSREALWRRLACGTAILVLGAFATEARLFELLALAGGLVVPSILRKRVRRFLPFALVFATLVLSARSLRMVLLEQERFARETTVYGNDERPDAGLAYGECTVNIPNDHKVAVLEGPKFYEFAEDPERHIMILSTTVRTEDEWLATINARNASSALVFIHGYSTSFNDAARRIAQIVHDLEFRGVPILYSWRSAGGMEQYTWDSTAAQQTVLAFRAFLHSIRRNLKVDEIHLVAHSMGNRALCEALEDPAFGGDKPHFHEIVLAAPDIDARVFRTQIAPRIVGNRCGHRLTLYASSHDKALQLSKEVNGGIRAGDSGDDLVVVDGIDTIDVSELPTTFLGHSYYAENNSVITDLRALLLQRAAMAARTWLSAVEIGTRKYWKFVLGP